MNTLPRSIVSMLVVGNAVLGCDSPQETPSAVVTTASTPEEPARAATANLPPPTAAPSTDPKLGSRDTPPASAGALTASNAQPTSIAAQHILIMYRGAERAEKAIKRSKVDAKALAEKVRDEAKTGTDFSALVSKYSEDPGAKDRLGSLGKFTPDKMHAAFSSAAFKLKVSEISEVVETPFGFHIIKRNQ